MKEVTYAANKLRLLAKAEECGQTRRCRSKDNQKRGVPPIWLMSTRDAESVEKEP